MIPSTGDFTVADSSFYICFLEDIKRSDTLLLMFNEFDFAMGDKVHSEISKCTHYGSIQGNKHIVVVSGLNFAEILRPFFGKYETEKGEGEIIALAVLLHGMRRIKRLIIDEDGPREFVERNLPHLKYLMTGTVGFVGKCNYEMHILEKDYSLQILSEIENSPFRVSKKVLYDVRSQII